MDASNTCTHTGRTLAFGSESLKQPTKLPDIKTAAFADVQSEAINKAACKLAREAAAEGDALVSASISETPSYREGKGKVAVVEQFRNQVAFLKTCDVDFIICEVPV